MDIPVELFLGFIGVSIAIALFGFVRNPQIPACLVMGGMFILFISVATDNIIVDFSSNLESTDLIVTNGTEIVRTYIYNVNFTQSSGLVLTQIGAGEFAQTGSTLIGQSFQCMEILLGRTTTLPDNPIYFGIMNNTGHLTFNFTSFQPTDIETQAEQYEACLPTDLYYTIIDGDRIGVKTVVVNNARIYLTYQDSSNPYDGTISYRQGWSGSAWTGNTSNDMTMKLYNNTINIVPLEQTTFTYETAPAVYEFTEIPKTLFALVGVMCMLVGGLMVMRD